MNAEQRQRVSDAVEREHPYPDDDGAHPFALDEDGVPVALTPEQEDWAALFSPPLVPQYEAVAIVSPPDTPTTEEAMPAGLDGALGAVLRLYETSAAAEASAVFSPVIAIAALIERVATLEQAVANLDAALERLGAVVHEMGESR